MELLKLNNEISGMRPSARQSKVHVMHHLTRKAAALRKKKGPEELKAGYQKKAERIMQEALIIKDLVHDEIIKFSLQFDANLRNKVLNDTSLPFSAKAFALVASHPIMAKAVDAFREKYPDWTTWLEKNLEKLGTGSRFGTKMKNGRVKAHLQQRQRVEEAVDTIRRAQMSWLHHEGKSKKKNKAEKNGEDSIEGKEVDNEKRSIGKRAESSDSITGKQRKSLIQDRSEENSLTSGSSDVSESEESTAELLPKSVKKPITDSNKSTNTRKCISKDTRKSKPVLYEEVDENESSSESELENNDEKKPRKAVTKTSLNKQSAPVEKEDRASEDNESADESGSENSSDQSENSVENESEASGEESGFLKESEKDKRRAKKLLKKEIKKQKSIIPRSREVEVCKFSDLLKKKVTRTSDDDDNSSESDAERPESPEKGVDPFFMTRNNDLLRIATARREAKPEEPVRAGPKWGIEGSENWTGTRQERRARARRMMGIPDPEGFSRRRGPPKLDPPPFPRQRENRRESLPMPIAKNVPSDEPEKLHPSWAAKRKMNIASVGFQGKKVKFDDSD